jgi:hypothetical protein
MVIATGTGQIFLSGAGIFLPGCKKKEIHHE